MAFQTSDGLLLSADYYPPAGGDGPAPFVILLHMSQSSRVAWVPLAEPLQKAGFAVLALDLRGHGESRTEELAQRVKDRDALLYEDMYKDLRAAYDWMASQEEVDRSRFALVGADVGASVALRYATYDRSVDAIVCLSPGLAYMGLDSASDMAKIKGRRILLLSNDSSEEQSAASKLAKLSAGARHDVVKSDLHGTDMFSSGPELAGTVAEFLKKNVGGRTKTTVYGTINSPIYHLPGSGWIERIGATNMRHYSSPEEAEARGVRKARSRRPEDGPADDEAEGRPQAGQRGRARRGSGG